MAPRVFVAPATGLGLSPVPRVVAPVAFAAFRVAMLRRLDTTSSPRGVLRRAFAEPLLRVSLSSALAPSRPLLTYLFVALCVIGIHASITRLETGFVAETAKYAAKNEATAGCLPKITQN